MKPIILILLFTLSADATSFWPRPKRAVAPPVLPAISVPVPKSTIQQSATLMKSMSAAVVTPRPTWYSNTNGHKQVYIWWTGSAWQSDTNGFPPEVVQKFVKSKHVQAGPAYPDKTWYRPEYLYTPLIRSTVVPGAPEAFEVYTWFDLTPPFFNQFCSSSWGNLTAGHTIEVQVTSSLGKPDSWTRVHRTVWMANDPNEYLGITLKADDAPFKFLRIADFGILPQ